MGQIAWRDLKTTVYGQDLPDEGGISIFTFTEVHTLGIVETVIRPWSPEIEVQRRATPERLLGDPYGDGVNGPYEPHAILFREVLSLPDATDGPFKEVLPGFKWGEPDTDLYIVLREACGENCHGLGGYLSATSGKDPSPGVDWMRLLVMRTNPDCGVVHFSIPEADLAKGDITNAAYVWMDWDS